MIKTFDDLEKSELFQNGEFDSIIKSSDSVLRNHNLGENINITDTPISPMAIDSEHTPVFLSEQVTCEYKKLVRDINVPETAREYALVLLGKFGKTEGLSLCLVDKIIYCGSDKLSSRFVQYDQDKLNEVLRDAISNGYNFISLAHTHPRISEEEKTTTIAEYLSDEVREKENIRDAGLNISLQDFISYESLYQYFKNNPNIQTCQTIIMYNGEIAMFGKVNGQYKRYVDISDLSTGEVIYVSHEEEQKKM